MNAWMVAGMAAARAAAQAAPRDASRQSDRSQVKTPALATGRCTAIAFACKPKQPAHVVRWLVATAALARTDRRPIPEGKACTALLPVARGSRASTDPKTPPNLLNPSKGLSMAKTACVSLQLVMKSVPVVDSIRSAHLPQTTPGESMHRRGYTLCEVRKKKGGSGIAIIMEPFAPAATQHKTDVHNTAPRAHAKRKQSLTATPATQLWLRETIAASRRRA